MHVCAYSSDVISLPVDGLTSMQGDFGDDEFPVLPSISSSIYWADYSLCLTIYPGSLKARRFWASIAGYSITENDLYLCVRSC